MPYEANLIDINNSSSYTSDKDTLLLKSFMEVCDHFLNVNLFYKLYNFARIFEVMTSERKR